MGKTNITKDQKEYNYNSYSNNENTIKNNGYNRSPQIVQNLSEVKGLHSQQYQKKQKTNKHKKPSRKIKFIKNPHLNFNGIKETYKKCKVKSGLIFLMRKKEKKEISLQPVLAKIDLANLSFYLSNSPKSKFYQINLLNILRISRTKFDEKHNCFNIVLNFSEENTLRKEPLTLCLKGKRKVNDWMRTINEFKECQID